MEAFSTEEIYIYLAGDLLAGAAHPEGSESIDIIREDLRTALGWARRGEIRDSKTLVGLLTYAQQTRPGLT